jgi:hypothetical protein
MKKVIFAATLLAAFSVSVHAENGITIVPVAASAPALNVRNVDPRLLRGLCMQAVAKEETPTRKIRIEDVELSSGASEGVAECQVKATLLEGAGLVMNGGSYTATDVNYGVSVDLSTGATHLARYDESAARDVALAALAKVFIDVKPTALSSDNVTYRAKVGSRTCVVRVTTQVEESEPKHWLVDRLDCKQG